MPVPLLSTLLQQGEYTITIMEDGTSVLMDLNNEALLTFNGTATLMLAAIEQGASSEAIVTQIIETYQIDRDTAQADVDEFIGNLTRALGLQPSA
jgi:phosphatidylglycerophosphatase A